MLVDPGCKAGQIARWLDEHGLRAVGMSTLTVTSTTSPASHARRRFGLSFAIHTGEKLLVQALPVQARMFGLAPPEAPEVDRWLA